MTNDLTPDQLLPAPKMGMIEAVKTVFRKYFTVSGRARRAEYWWFILFAIVVAFVFAFIDKAIAPDVAFGEGGLAAIFNLVTLVPSITVAVRRLHDIGRSGWWLLAPFGGILVALAVVMVTNGLLPSGVSNVLYFGLLAAVIVAWIVLFYWTVKRSQPGSNRFGPSPLEVG